MLLWPDVMNGLHRVHELTSWCFYQKLCAFSELFLWGISHELGNRNSQKTKIILLKITQRDISEHWSYHLCPLGPHLGSDLELRSHLWDLEVISCLEGHSFSHTSWFAHRPCRLLQASHILVAEKPQGTMRERERERERGCREAVVRYLSTDVCRSSHWSVKAGREDRRQGQSAWYTSSC